MAVTGRRLPGFYSIRLENARERDYADRVNRFFPTTLRQWASLALKLIGVAVFIWILQRIDLPAVWAIVSQADVPLLLLSFALLLFSYLLKTLRWHALVLGAGAKPTLLESWKLYTIGIFLGNVTPSNIGELGKIPYLRKHGLQLHTATIVIGLDRIFDMLIMGVMAAVSIGILYDWFWTGLVAAILLPFALLLWMLRKRIGAVRLFFTDLGFLPRILSKESILELLVLSVAVWATYFVWTSLLARALGIVVPLPELIAAITLAAAVALLPIAPAGLGTRDAAYLGFLVPLGVASEQSLAFSLVFFVWVILSCIPGLISWLQGIKPAPRKATGIIDADWREEGKK